MRKLLIAATLLCSSVALAQPAATDAATTVDTPVVRVLGQLNVNEATRGQLLTVPGLDPTLVDALLAQRGQQGTLAAADLTQLPAEALAHLKTDGESDYRRIKRLPLQLVIGGTALATSK